MRSGRVSWTVSCDADVRYWRWRAANERPIVPAPIKVIRLDSSLKISFSVDMIFNVSVMKDEESS